MRCPSWPTCRWRSSATSCSTASCPGAPTTTSPFSPCAAAPGTPSGRAEHGDGLTYTAVLPVAEESVPSCRGYWPPSDADEAPGPDGGRWAATGRQCWCCAGSSMAPGWPAGRRPPHRSLDGLPVPARGHRRARRRGAGARGALLTARAAGDSHVTVGGTLIGTDRCRAPGATARGTGPTGGWTCGGRASTPPMAAMCRSSPHPTAGRCGPRRCGPAASTTPPPCEPTPRRCHCWPSGPTGEHATLADLGYEGERAALTTPIEHGAGRRLTDDQRTVHLLHAATRAPAERGNSLLKTTFTALRRVSLRPWRIGAITAAALVLLHY